MTGLDRRGFVKLGASGAALLAVPFARGEGVAKQLQAAAAPLPVAGPFNWSQFRDEMKKRNQPGVIVLLQQLGQHGGAAPEQEKLKEELKKRAAERIRDDGQSNDLATAVHNALFNCGECELPQMLVQAVFAAVPADQARKEFPALPTGAGLALISVDGKVLSTLPADAELGVKFAARVGQLLYGKDSGLLAERVKAERAALGDADCKKLDQALVDLDDDEFSRRQGASLVLTGLFPRIGASLAQAYRNAQSMEVRSRIDSLFRKKLHDENSAALLQRSLAPYVAAAANFDVRIKCGQGALRPEAHAFVQLWCAAVVQG